MKTGSKFPGLILASKSPRRRYLLEQTGIDFSVVPSNFNEKLIAPSSPERYVRQLAESKAKDISQKYPASWVIGADTVVFIDNVLLGKPDSRDEAWTMLNRLSGKTHQVLTGYCICCHVLGHSFSDTVKTDVSFKELTKEEINWYLNSGEPFDKAGAYAIQGIGTFLVKRINGSYTNVVGLPVCEVMEILINEGVMDLSAAD